MEESFKSVSVNTLYVKMVCDKAYKFDRNKYCLNTFGTMTFGFIKDEIQFFKKPYSAPFNKFERVCGDLMIGRDFYEEVDYGGIIDYDGTLGNVYIDGYKSNLGLYHKDFCQGRFIVDGETWLDICKNHEVLVEWCNR